MALVVEIVKNGHLFIEIEESNEHVDKIYEDVEEMKKDLIGLELDVEIQIILLEKRKLFLMKNINKR